MSLLGKMAAERDRQPGEPRGRRWKAVQLFALFWGHFFNGLYLTLPGPTLPSLQLLIGVSESQVTAVFAASVLPAVVGAALAPLLERRLGQNLALGLLFLLAAVTNAMMVLVTSLPAFTAIFCLTHFFLMGMSTLLVVRLHTLWGKQAGIPMHFVTSGTGLGSLLVPFLVQSFTLSPECLKADSSFQDGIVPGTYQDRNSSTHPRGFPVHHAGALISALLENDSVTSNGTPGADRHLSTWAVQNTAAVLISENCNNQITRVFFLVSCFAFPAIVIFFHAAIKDFRDARQPHYTLLTDMTNGEDTEGKESDNDEDIKERQTQTNLSYKQKMLLLLMCCFTVVNFSAVTSYTNYLTLYGMEVFSLSQHTMASMTSLTMACFTIGRLISVGLATRIHPEPYMWGCLGALLGSGLLLELWGSREAMGLWVGSGLWGLLVAPFFAALFHWGHHYVSMTAPVIAVLMIGAACGSPLLSATSGLFVSRLGPHGFTVFCLTLWAYVLFIFSTMLVLAKWFLTPL